ncbi:hypothetical protein H4582DRAFT_1934889 [Lactarius indigo]|nr:hypothetical protein H4582DRAFT_1934889 [Lactarius indigo]
MSQSFRCASSLNCLSGDVVFTQVFGQAVVVLCSTTAIKELLERRGDLYADRTPLRIFEMFARYLSSLPHRR